MCSVFVSCVIMKQRKRRNAGRRLKNKERRRTEKRAEREKEGKEKEVIKRIK